MEHKYKLDYSLISNRIKEGREAAHLTQAQLAESIDISTNAIAQMETHRMRPKLRTLLNIANVLGADVNYFLRDSINEFDVEDDEMDLALNARLRGLSSKEKAFLIHVIDGLKTYNNSP